MCSRTEADYELTFNLDHSVGADHAEKVCRELERLGQYCNILSLE
jgi:hypothetical protein